uniref:Uncharacterized protein n=1 Tax=Amphimedon queenslandica TaxID=400682 RepID=A0A1X7SEB1_AMPQE
MLRSVLKETTCEDKMGRVTRGKAGEELRPGILCKVKEGKKLYDGRILAIGIERNL